MRYVTYEGRLCRYTSIILSYYCFFKGQGLNMPFYLINTLQKMAYLFQNNAVEKDRYLFHHGLFKILITHRLS